jgi:hypothetical protein
MHASNEPNTPPVAQDNEPPIATFKTSLRAWQAEYQARLAAQQAKFSEEAENQTSPP